MRHHFRHPQAMYHKGSLFYSHCGWMAGAGCMQGPHHAEGRVDPKVRERQNGFRFWIAQSM
jgi:hypothetical protein